MRWEIASTRDEAKASRLCEQGWEPFAVTSVRSNADSSRTDATHYFRRQAAVEPTKDAGWEPLAKALFEIERDPQIKDQAWFDFQGKAQRLVALMSQQPQN
jgi:hypothetical protein